MANLPYPKSGVNTPQAKAQREAYWRDVIRRWKLSGLSKTDFCKGRAFSSASLHFWLKELRRRDQVGAPKPTSPAKATFVPVRVALSAPSTPEPIEILVDGHRVLVRAGFDPDVLRKVVLALEVRQC